MGECSEENPASQPLTTKPEYLGRATNIKPLALTPAQVLSVQNKKLVDILNPKREPFPIDLPPIGAIRKQAFTKKQSYIDISSSKAPSRNKIRFNNHEVPFVEGDDNANPFEYPRSIEDFIAKVEIEHAEQRRKESTIYPLMKGTNLYKQSQIVLSRIKPFLQPSFKPSLAQDYKQVVWKAQHGLHINHFQKVSRKMHTEYIMQRKSIYYLRREIKAKKLALEMVEKTRKFEETCLKDYEWLTNFTVSSFDTFLRQNDEKTYAATKKAETAIKEKLEKTFEVRQLNVKINQMKTDIIATNESLRECKVYMRFLDDIAREIMRKDEEEEIRQLARAQQVTEEVEEFVEEGLSLEEAEEMVEEKAQEMYDEILKNNPELDSLESGSVEFIATLHKQLRQYLGLPDEPEPVEEEVLEEADLQRNDSGPISPKSNMSIQIARKHSKIPTTAAEKFEKFGVDYINMKLASMTVLGQGRRSWKDSTGDDSSVHGAEDVEDVDGYNEYALLKPLNLVPGDEESDRRELAALKFTRPGQLLQIYKDMEETNVSLTQHCKAAEEEMELVKTQVQETRKTLNDRGKKLREDISRLQADVDINEKRATTLATLVDMFTGDNYDVKQQQNLYKVLQHHVAKVYKSVVGGMDHHLNLNPLMMLAAIEQNYQDLISDILQSVPEEVVVQISKELDKERREKERLEKMNKRKEVQEERKSRALGRSQASVYQKKGRPLLARSHPPRMTVHLPQVDLTKPN